MSMSSPYQGDKGQNVRVTDDYEQDWGRVFRLVFISGVATLTTMGKYVRLIILRICNKNFFVPSIFTISAIIVDDLLRKKGEFCI